MVKRLIGVNPTPNATATCLIVSIRRFEFVSTSTLYGSVVESKRLNETHESRKSALSLVNGTLLYQIWAAGQIVPSLVSIAVCRHRLIHKCFPQL